MKNQKPMCLYNAIKTPDGTILWCQTEHDYQSHKDAITGETYMNDGIQSIRRSINKVEAKDISIWSNDPFEKVRKAKFWGSYGKTGKGKKRILSLKQMSEEHIKAILETQPQIKGRILEELFMKELQYRKKIDLENTLEEKPKQPRKKL